MSELSEAPAPFDINLDDAAAAWQALRDSEHQNFAWAIFTFPENLFAKCLEVHRQEKGGITEMCAKIQELTNNTQACWGGFKVHAVNQNNYQEHTVKFIGFQFVPVGCKINAKRVAKDIRPHVERLLCGTDLFIDASTPDELSDSPSNCSVLAQKLKLSSEQALQCHAVADIAPVSAAFSVVKKCAEDVFSYVLIVPHLEMERTFDIVSSNEGGVTEMIEQITALTENSVPIFGAYKVQSVDATAAARTTQCIKFVFGDDTARKTYNRVLMEMQPYVLGAIDADLCIDVKSVDELCNFSGLATQLGLSDRTLQFHSVRNAKEVGAAIQVVMKSGRDEFPYVVITTSENNHTRDLVVHKSTSGGLEEMLEILQKVFNSGRPSYGVFKVQSVDDSSFSRKKPIRAKFVTFRCVPNGDASAVREIAPYVASVLDKSKFDMFIDGSDVDDVSNTMAVAEHLRLNDTHTCYDFGGEVMVRPSVLLNVDKEGKETVEIAHTMDAWSRVQSNQRKESFAIFTLSADRKKLQVICDGCGPGLKSCQVATNVVMSLCKPVWGVFRVQGQNEENNNAAKRVKFVVFQVIPPDTPPSVSSTVRVMKPLLRETLKQATCWIEAESSDCFCEEVVSKKLTDMSGAENATKFDFGGELTAEDEKLIIKTVEKHLAADAASPA